MRLSSRQRDFGAFQVAVATMLDGVGIDWAVAIGFGFGLQAIETLSTMSAGLPAAAKEGIRHGAVARISRSPAGPGTAAQE